MYIYFKDIQKDTNECMQYTQCTFLFKILHCTKKWTYGNKISNCIHVFAKYGWLKYNYHGNFIVKLRNSL